MSKSVYSIVLTDDVVEAIDRLAYSMNTSRSNLINQILAERVSYVTPEKRMSDIFETLGKLMSDSSDNFQIQQQPSDDMLSIRSALKYKYKPTIRYSLQLYRSFDKTIGELKVSFRTQSAQLISILTDFLKLWVELENTYVVRFFPEGIRYVIEDGRFTRIFRLPHGREGQSNSQIAEAIAEYIQMFDEILKVYFANAEDKQTACAEVKKAYGKYLQKGLVVI